LSVSSNDIFGGVGPVSRKKLLHFGGNPDSYVDFGSSGIFWH